MTTTQLTQIIAIAATALALLGLAGILVLAGRLRRLQRQQRVIMGSAGERDLVQHVVSLDERMVNLRTAVEDLGLASRDHEARIDACTSRLGVVRFDAYEDLGGRQSTAIALMDAKEDGVVMTTVVSRDFARMYVKLLRDGRPDVPLAPEEIEAVDQARARAPFTIRPRMDEPKRTEEEPATAEEEAAEGAEAMRALERENRRRERQGLAPLDELPPPPSTQGWQALDIPAGEPSDGEAGEDATLDHVIDPAAGEGLAEPPGDGDRAQPTPAGDAARGDEAPGGRAAGEDGRAREDQAADDRPAGDAPEPDADAGDQAGRQPAAAEPAADLWFDDDEAPDWPERTHQEDRPREDRQ